MRRGKTGTIALIQFGGLLQVDDVRALCTARAIRGQGYHVLNSHVLWHPEGVQDALDAALDLRVEGLVLVGPNENVPESFLRQLRDSEIPCVSLSGVRFPGIPQIRDDIRQGFFDLTKHLLLRGYREVALLTGWDTDKKEERFRWAIMERIQGFREAATEFGLGEREAEVVFQEWHPDWLVPPVSGRLGMQKILGRPHRPRAVLCSNDNWALGALSACAEAGVRIPHDIAITGFDNDVSGQFFVPPLTTAAQSTEAMATKAVEMLVAMIRRERLSIGDELVKMPCQLVVRQSCGAKLEERKEA